MLARAAPLERHRLTPSHRRYRRQTRNDKSPRAISPAQKSRPALLRLGRNKLFVLEGPAGKKLQPAATGAETTSEMIELRGRGIAFEMSGHRVVKGGLSTVRGR